MISKEKLIVSILQSRIKSAKKQLIDAEKLKEESKKIPQDCLGKDVFNDGIINENPYLREDGLTNAYHQIGYLTALKCELELVIKYIKMSEEEINESLEKDKEIEKQNKEYLDNIFKKFKT